VDLKLALRGLVWALGDEGWMGREAFCIVFGSEQHFAWYYEEQGGTQSSVTLRWAM
jgi:hypothetical protein